jgi:hypothetical protein
MQSAAPGRVELGNGWRSNEQQRRLHAQKPGLAAKPGHSNHEFGLALDITYENAATRRWVHANAHRFGLWFPMDYEPWHVQLIGVDRHNIRGGAQQGGGRNAFAMAPDGRFINPYDAMAGYMQGEDNTDPGTQFSRLVNALVSPQPGGGVASPEMGALASPSLEGERPDLEQAAGTLAQEGAAMTGPTDHLHAGHAH